MTLANYVLVSSTTTEIWKLGNDIGSNTDLKKGSKT